MKILVTGGAGYIGSHTLVKLLEDGHEVAVVDNLSAGRRTAMDRVKRLTNRDFLVHEVDIRDKPALSKVFEQFLPEAVIHFAGLKSVSESVSKPLMYYSNNLSGSVTLFEVMDQFACKKIVFSSSATVYGAPKYVPYDEKHPTAPINAYGRTKLMTEEILADWVSADPSKSVSVLRYFNPVGAHESGIIGEDPMGVPANLMPYIAQVAVGRHDHVKIYGNDYPTKDGTGERDYIHVVDLASAHVAAIDRIKDTLGFEIFNLGTGQSTSVLELIEAFQRQSGREIPYKIVERRAGDLAAVWADPKLASEKLKWRAELDCETMCRDVWRWQSENPEGYDQK